MMLFLVMAVGVPQDEQFVYINRALFIVYTILSCIGICLATICLIMNLIFKERKYVKSAHVYILYVHCLWFHVPIQGGQVVQSLLECAHSGRYNHVLH